MTKLGFSNLSKRTRASKPKVTTGCVTCKARHVKCDEKKPNCHRCQSTGRKCDWESLTKFTVAPNTVTAPLSPALKQIPGTLEERGCFQFFYTRTVVQLSGLFGSTFWNQYVLQACIYEPTVWHAVVAVASLHQELSPGNFPSGGRDVALSHFTLKQYVQAMQHLRKPHQGRETPPGVIALICCVLFICFESLRGHYATALVHLDYGLRLLSEMQIVQSVDQIDSKISRSRNHLHYSKTLFAPVPSIALILTRLDTQATQLLCYRKTHLFSDLKDTGITASQEFPTTFASLEEARRVFDQVWNFCLYNLQTPDVTTSVRFGDTRAAKLQVCTNKLQQWSVAFGRFIENSSQKLDAIGRQATNVMRIYYIIGEMGLCPEYNMDMDNEETWRYHEREFSEIVCLATSIIDSSAVESLAGDTVLFTLDTCVLGPLYFVATRCRHKILRRKAISLLRLSRRIEGLWDGLLWAQIAERVVEIEEEGVSHRVSSSKLSSISDVSIRFENERRRALVKYIFQGEEDLLGGGDKHREDLLVW